MLRLRWITWWPAPYWTDRFNALATRPELQFEAYFLSTGSKFHSWRDDISQYRFGYRFLTKNSDTASGYFSPRITFPRPFALLSGNPDVVVMPYSDISCMSALGLSRVLGLRVGLFVPNTADDTRDNSWLREWMKKGVFRASDFLVTTGRKQRDYALRYVREDHRIYGIGNPSQDLRRTYARLKPARRAIREAFGWGDATVLVYAGRLSPEKRVEDLIQAIGRAPSSIRGAINVAIAGKGPSEGLLRELAKAHDVSATFLGFIQSEELVRLYASADVFVLPSQMEPWGLVVNEAMQCELPVIASSNVGAVHELLEPGANGFIYSVGDIESLKAYILDMVLHPGRRTEMGIAARLSVEGHSVDSWCNAVVGAVQDVMRGRT